MRIELFPPKDMFEVGARANQEDSIFPLVGKAKESDRLFVLCDGMGGHERGEVASAAICQGIMEYFQENVKTDEVLADEQLKNALEHAYLKLDAIDDGAYRKAGTTMTMLFFHRGGCTAAHIGDSRIYHVRPSSGTILYKSKDHSLVYELYQMGEISYEEMKTHRRKNQITRAMLPGEDNREQADIVHITDIQPGDYFFLCSDGVLEDLDDPDIVKWMTSDTDDDQKREWLIENTVNSKDNHSAFLIRIKGVEREEGDEALLDDEQTVRFNAINIHPVLRKRDAPAVEEAPEPESQDSVDDQKIQKDERKRKRLSPAALACLSACFVALIALGWWLFKPISEKSSKTTKEKALAVEDASANRPEKDSVNTVVDAKEPVQEESQTLSKEMSLDMFQAKLMEEYKNKEEQERHYSNDVYGEYTYKGPVDNDSLPHGEGMAVSKKGFYKGPFEHGVFQGDRGVYIFNNGEYFQGSFKDNLFNHGHLYKDNGSYYGGRFEKGKPWNGVWRGYGGKRISIVVEGKDKRDVESAGDDENTNDSTPPQSQDQ
ncbi:MAG: protein phosphatase 2C domain-containing protein [Prevotella sp.]|nr:protein phosphatase 2C domain-containing protein [Prevotella sp.]